MLLWICWQNYRQSYPWFTPDVDPFWYRIQCKYTRWLEWNPVGSAAVTGWSPPVIPSFMVASVWRYHGDKSVSVSRWAYGGLKRQIFWGKKCIFFSAAVKQSSGNHIYQRPMHDHHSLRSACLYRSPTSRVKVAIQGLQNCGCSSEFPIRCVQAFWFFPDQQIRKGERVTTEI